MTVVAQPLDQGACHTYNLPPNTPLAATVHAEQGRLLVQLFINKPGQKGGVSHLLDSQFILIAPAPQQVAQPEAGRYTLRVSGLDPQNAYRLEGLGLTQAATDLEEGAHRTGQNMRPGPLPQGVALPDLPWRTLEHGDWDSYVFPHTLRISATGQVQHGQILVQVFKYEGQQDTITQQYLIAASDGPITHEVTEPGFYIIRVTGLAAVGTSYRAVGEWTYKEEFDLALSSTG